MIQNALQNELATRVLVVGSDARFGRSLAKCASESQVQLAYYRSAEAIRGQLTRGKFDVAILDGSLRPNHGLDSARYLERFLWNLPVVWVTQNATPHSPGRCSHSIWHFIAKASGANHILQTALRLAKNPSPAIGEPKGEIAMMTTILNEWTTTQPIVPEEAAEQPRVLLLDDDRIYGLCLQREAQRLGIRLQICRSLEEVEAVASTFRADAAIFDYYLDDATTGEAAARALESSIPVLMISASEPGLPHSREHWPKNVRRFLPKTVGPRTILEAALAEHHFHTRETLANTASELLIEPLFRYLWPTLVILALALLLTSFVPPAVPLTPSEPTPPRGILWDGLDTPHTGMAIRRG